MSNLKQILENKEICKSVWFMRQAGRYLPEFSAIRSRNQNFINLCLDSKLSSEITLQPINRFDLDSAIIFSDILMVPYALNQKVEFLKDLGPVLEEFNFKKFLNNDKISFTQKLHPVYKAIQKTRKNLDKKKSLIGFALFGGIRIIDIPNRIEKKITCSIFLLSDAAATKFDGTKSTKGCSGPEFLFSAAADLFFSASESYA